MALNLPIIIKRLNLISNLIALEEVEYITEHTDKLRHLQPDEDVREIINHLQEKSYGKAVEKIQRFINQHQQVAIYSDPEIEAIKLEVKSLESEINNLSNEKADLEKLIHEFGIRHNRELGELIIKILKYRKERAKDDQEQRDATEDYDSYQKEYDASKNEEIRVLSPEEQKELKDKYRKASKLCHPDVVSEDQKDLATKLFAELSAAYERNDLNGVSEILKKLESGQFFINKSDAITEKELLKTEIEKLQLILNKLKGQLQAIKESDTYKTIAGILDWDEYFEDTKQKLMLKLNDLENGKQ